MKRLPATDNDGVNAFLSLCLNVGQSAGCGGLPAENMGAASQNSIVHQDERRSFLTHESSAPAPDRNP